MPPTCCVPIRAEIDIGRVDDLVAVDHLGARKHRVGDLFGRRPAIADIVLDAEIAVRPARIVAGRQDEPAERLVVADDVAGGRASTGCPPCPTSTLPNPLAAAMRDGLLDGDVVEVAAVAADHQRLALEALEAVEDRLDEVLDIVGLLETRRPACAGPRCPASGRRRAWCSIVLIVIALQPEQCSRRASAYFSALVSQRHVRLHARAAASCVQTFGRADRARRSRRIASPSACCARRREHDARSPRPPRSPPRWRR